MQTHRELISMMHCYRTFEWIDGLARYCITSSSRQNVIFIHRIRSAPPNASSKIMTKMSGVNYCPTTKFARQIRPIKMRVIGLFCDYQGISNSLIDGSLEDFSRGDCEHFLDSGCSRHGAGRDIPLDHYISAPNRQQAFSTTQV